MSGPAKLALVIGGLAVVVVLFIVLRNSDDEGEASAPAAPTVTQPAPPPPAAKPSPPAPPAPPAQPRRPAPAVLRIAIRDGEVAGGLKRETVEKGQTVVVAVSAFVDDHVHVHGYDLFDDVGPGQPARISFRATIPGRFEIELEDRSLQIAELEVRP